MSWTLAVKPRCYDGLFCKARMKDTSEQYRPSMKTKPRKEKTLLFSPSVQHVRNAEMMLLCEECEMWRLIYAVVLL